ncbi:xylose ABC transporter ATP-binding protein [Pontibacillus halophilus JSM 076056 = DSM 19796]|uniref:Xylose ABC transporter ATP-binding protein n=1 Tax=Pontibacillus halophilus JSM 076056 = DSM 19796 TaxID=1385510 RepID=A0A0A5ID00_9BACI|nr:sugar ABC transporter ATP-binding protein [Pontibacillus halophilus]KGX93722.1 xylose ABC transporter ATP-binding protein [Pontibacillus halophilus JSM 076056 = DSM 19796]
MSDYILEMKNISKEFTGVKALSNVNFKVERGEIHCLVGENGAGKSTLMKVLSGVYPYGEYEGDIVFDGNVQQFNKISDSVETGIVIIYQELALFPDLSVYENIFIGNELQRKGVLDWNEAIVKSKELLNKVNLHINPEILIKELGVGKQQLVEIAKALSKKVKLLILDEPTAALNDKDSENLLDLLRELKKQGITSIMISHKLNEVISIADKATVLRDGQTITTLDASNNEINENEIIKNMVGREIEDIYPKRNIPATGDVLLELTDWTAYDSRIGRNVAENVNLKINYGEIVGIAGLMGAGRTELALSIFGNSENYKTSGHITIDNQPVTLKHTSDAIKAGIAYVTEDRKGDGLFLLQDIKQNISISNLKELANYGVVNENEEIKVAEDYRQSLGIKTPSIQQTVGNLSGGNQQKVSIGKWLYVGPKLLILDEPTRGIDVGAKLEIYTVMNKLIESGMSILMISSELGEVLGMSDRVYVMAKGEIKGELSTKEASQEKIMELATQ